MGIKTKISYCNSTINPIMGCSPGCDLRRDHCYAATLCARYAGHKGWPKSFDDPEHFPGRIEKALRWSDMTGKARPDKPWLDGYPRIIFVNDLSDGFCPDVDPDTWLPPQLLGPMAASPHIWLLLTKWPDRMRMFFERYQIPDNFWLGTSICRQHDEWRVKELLQIQEAAVKFVSCEPLLAEVDIEKYLQQWQCPNCLTWQHTSTFCDCCETEQWENIDAAAKRGISWIIAGGESGPNARPMNPDWARGIKDQCQATETPYFHKQNGAWIHQSQTTAQQKGQMYNKVNRLPSHVWPDDSHSWRVGKHYAGRLLDGRTWSEMPEGE